MSRRVWLSVAVGAVVVALVVGAIFYFTSGDAGSAYPTFSSTPAPDDYESLADLAAALEAKGLPCKLEYQDMDAAGQETIEEFATCLLFADPGKNVELWRFKDEGSRDRWGAAFASSTLVITGPNWIATPQDQERADAVRGAIGGSLSGKVPTP